ncbi:MAG: NAD(P)/FAD-dependent oxidoreductase [Pseudomonadota bacterium]
MPVAVKAQSCDVIVLGAGGAGLMCAGIAGTRGRSVVMLVKLQRPPPEIRIFFPGASA